MLNTNRGGSRPNSGRKAPAGVRRNIGLRLSESELTTIQQFAQAAGQTVSDYIRYKALQQ